MAGEAGLKFVIKQGTTVIGGMETNSVTVNGDPISNEDQTSEGFAQYLAGVLVNRSMEFTGEGLVKSYIFRDARMATDPAACFFDDLVFELPNGDTISGSFVLTAYGETGAFRDAQRCTLTIMTDGAWTYTKASAA